SLSLVFLIVVFTTGQLASGEPYYKSKSIVMTEMVNETNELRLRLGLNELNQSRSLEESAQNKASDMSQQNYWGHYAPSGQSYSDYIWQSKPNAVTVGENLAKCFDDYQSAFDRLVDSPTHYAVLTGNFEYIGVSSVVQEDGCESIVMHFASN
ncbi:MAG: CAP domain-containing protein, partial [Patescibacteria group bacterium]|nr:CAP domain-containing protein [Patescibacteria group bacterium]